ncbi:unnamed protein product, partial [Discosporangium mesarthrocarpum]
AAVAEAAAAAEAEAVASTADQKARAATLEVCHKVTRLVQGSVVRAFMQKPEGTRLGGAPGHLASHSMADLEEGVPPGPTHLQLGAACDLWGYAACAAAVSLGCECIALLPAVPPLPVDRVAAGAGGSGLGEALET